MTQVEFRNTKMICVGGGDPLEGKQDGVFTRLMEDFGAQDRINLAYIPIASLGDPRLAASLLKYVLALSQHLRKIDPRMAITCSSNPGFDEQKEIIRRADVVMLSGGDTRALIAWLRAGNVDRVLRRKYKSGTPIIGYSAGCLALAKKGFSFFESRYAKYSGISLYENQVPVIHYSDMWPSGFGDEYNRLVSRKLSPFLFLADNEAAMVINDKEVVNLT